MERANSRKQSKKPDGVSPELRVVAVNCNPAPDAQDRLRRLFSLLLELTAEESSVAPGEVVPIDHRPAEGRGQGDTQSDPEWA